VCRVSGFRTEDYAAELPSEAEQAKSYWDSVYADAASRAMSDPMPTGADIVAQDVAKFENIALQNVRSVVEDRRYARPQPAPPARSYMQPPATEREMGLR
jgi:uncharacterized protein YdbL (DUF1318 family)